MAQERKPVVDETSQSERRPQIKSRDRVRDLAEVYTHAREVNAMLDLVPDMFPDARDRGNIDRTFLEPACGHGNFLVEILRRKLKWVTSRRYGTGEEYEHRVLRCLASIYGIDICDDNVRESRGRLRAAVDEHIGENPNPDVPTTGFGHAVEVILETNVICADSLADAGEIELVQYRPASGGTFMREWSHPLDQSAGEPNLFSPEPRADEAPVHYSNLAKQIEPIVVDSAQRKAA